MAATLDRDQGLSPSLRARVSGGLHRRPWLRGLALLSPPAAWFVVLYLAALVVLFISAFWSVDDFTGKIVHSWSIDSFRTLVDDPTYRTIALRTIGIAAAVTVTDAILAIPFAYYAARLAPHYFNWRKSSIYGGSNEIQKNIIAKLVLGL